MLELTKRADYALRLMIVVAASENTPLSTSIVAKREGIPYQYLRKVAQQLVAAGLLTASRGKNGGLSLAHPAQTITLLEIVRVADEPALSRCLVDPAACTRRSRCVVFPVWRRLQREVERAMEGIVLSDLAEHHRAMRLNAENVRDGASDISERRVQKAHIDGTDSTYAAEAATHKVGTDRS